MTKKYILYYVVCALALGLGYALGYPYYTDVMPLLPAWLNNFWVCLGISVAIFIFVGRFEEEYLWNRIVGLRLRNKDSPAITAYSLVGLWVHVLLLNVA